MRSDLQCDFPTAIAAIILGVALFISITLQSLNIRDSYDDFSEHKSCNDEMFIAGTTEIWD